MQLARGSKIKCRKNYHSAYLFKKSTLTVRAVYGEWLWVIVDNHDGEPPYLDTFKKEEIEPCQP